MRKRNFLALLLALALLLCGCSEETAGTKPMDGLFEKTEASAAEGHLFFTGKVTSAAAEAKMISYYDAETEKSTFYKVEVTDDPFGCMPDRTLTVCVLGNSENFLERMTLEKGKEYLFDTTLWVQQEEAVLLLPTFYLALPEREGDVLYYTDQAGKAMVKGSYQDYWTRLKELAAGQGYSPETVLSAAKSRLQAATERDAAYFEELGFAALDQAALSATLQTAAALLKQAEATENTWEGIETLLQ